MSDRKRNEGWRADNPNRHKREIRYSPDLNLNVTTIIDERKKLQRDKIRRKSS